MFGAVICKVRRETRHLGLELQIWRQRFERYLWGNRIAQCGGEMLASAQHREVITCHPMHVRSSVDSWPDSNTMNQMNSVKGMPPKSESSRGGRDLAQRCVDLHSLSKPL